jgi:hypothetical protein
MVRRVLGLVQVLGAGWSAVVAVKLLLQAQVFRGDPGFALLLLGIITLVGVAGVELLRGRELGATLSFVAWIIQLLHVSFGEFAIRVVVGPQLTVTYSGMGVVQAYGGVTVSLNLLRTDSDTSFSLGINLVALGALILLAATVKTRLPQQRTREP